MSIPDDKGKISARVLPITGPYLGQVSSAASKVKLPPNAFSEVLNWVTNRGRLETRPKINSLISTADGRPVYIIRGFKDVNSSFHTLVVTDKNAYMFTVGPVTLNALSFPASVTDLGSANRPFGTASLLNRVYFSNGTGTVPVLYADGSNTLRVAGDVPGGARFLAVIGGHLMMAYLREDSRDLQNIVAWSAAGDANEYSGFTAGRNVLFEAPDEITGLVGASRSGFVFRTNGITLVTATGLGARPFAFEHLSTEPDGVGNRYPYSLASYGNRYTIFVGESDVYGVSLPDFEPLAGAVRREIFKDLSTANGPVIGRILPSLGTAYDFLAYYLTIPQSGTTTTWTLAIEEGTWHKFQHSTLALTAIGIAYTG